MGFLNSLSSLLDENSPDSFEKKIIAGLDKIENTLGATIDKAEKGANTIGKVGQTVDNIGSTIESADKKIRKVLKINKL